MGGRGSIIRGGFGKVLNKGFLGRWRLGWFFVECFGFWPFLVLLLVYWRCPCGWVFGLSLICLWSISVAPVRGGTYFSLSLPKKSNRIGSQASVVFQGVELRIMALSVVSSLRMQAVMATLNGLPA